MAWIISLHGLGGEISGLMHCLIECFRGRHRGVHNFDFCGSLRPFFMQQDEPFLPQKLHPREGKPLKHPVMALHPSTRHSSSDCIEGKEFIINNHLEVAYLSWTLRLIPEQQQEYEDVITRLGDILHRP